MGFDPAKLKEAEKQLHEEASVATSSGDPLGLPGANITVGAREITQNPDALQALDPRLLRAERLLIPGAMQVAASAIPIPQVQAARLGLTAVAKAAPYAMDLIASYAGRKGNEAVGFEAPTESGFELQDLTGPAMRGVGNVAVKGIHMTRPGKVLQHEIAQEKLAAKPLAEMPMFNPLTGKPIASLDEAEKVGNELFDYVEKAGNPSILMTKTITALDDVYGKLDRITIPALQTEVRKVKGVAKQWLDQLQTGNDTMAFANVRANTEGLSQLLDNLERQGGKAAKYAFDIKTAVRADLETAAGKKGAPALLRQANEFWARKESVKEFRDFVMQPNKGWRYTDNGQYVEVTPKPILTWLETEEGKAWTKNVVKSSPRGQKEVDSLKVWLKDMAKLPALQQQAWMPIAEKVALGMAGGAASTGLGVGPIGATAVSYAAYKLPDMWATLIMSTAGRDYLRKSLEKTGRRMTPEVMAQIGQGARALFGSESPEAMTREDQTRMPIER